MVVIGGLLYGVLLWVLGGRVLMPLALGVPVLVVGGQAWGSLVAHLSYGMLTTAGAADQIRGHGALWKGVADDEALSRR